MEIEFLYQGEVSLNILWRIFSLFLFFIFHSTFSRRSGIVWRNVAAFRLRKVNLWKKGRPMYRVHIVPSTEILHEFKCFLETRRKFLLLSKKGETALNLGGSKGEEEETPLIRPISKNIPIVHDETRFCSLTFFFSSSSFRFLCFLVFFQKFLLSTRKIIYKFIYINCTKDLEIRNIDRDLVL